MFELMFVRLMLVTLLFVGVPSSYWLFPWIADKLMYERLGLAYYHGGRSEKYFDGMLGLFLIGFMLAVAGLVGYNVYSAYEWALEGSV